MNTKTQRNGEIYENILKELNKRCAKRGEKVPFTVQQLRSKFKKCVGTCKQAALTIKSASGIKRFQEDKGFGQWFNSLYNIVKARDSCNPEMAIEPSALENVAGEANESEMESEDVTSNKSDENGGKDNLFIPIKHDKKKKKEDVAAEALQALNKIVERDHTKELIDFMKDQMQKSQEHELKVLQMILSSENARPSRNVYTPGIDPMYEQPHVPSHPHWNSVSTFQPILNPSPVHSRPSSSSSSSHSLNFGDKRSDEGPIYLPL